MYGEKPFPCTSKKEILERDQRFFAEVLSQIDLGNVDMQKMLQGPVQTPKFSWAEPNTLN